MVNTDIVFSLQTNFNLLGPAVAQALKGISRSCRLFSNFLVSVSHMLVLLLLLDGELRRFWKSYFFMKVVPICVEKMIEA